jgi:hypothetical protein
VARGNSITVRIVGDERDLLRSYARSQAASSKFASHVEKSGRGALAASGAFSHLGRAVSFASTSFLGGAGLVYALKSSIGAASDLHEQVNKTDVVFGRSAGVVKSWSKTTARSIGIAQHEALGFASTFGNLLHPMGIARAEAAKMSVRLVKLAADMASFNNASPEETLRALQAGLVGQVRPLRQFGVFLSDARVKAEAFADGIAKADVNQRKVAESSRAVEIAQFKLNEARKKYGEHSVQAAQAELTLQRAQDKLTSTMKGSKVELTDQQKALARYRIILKDTADSQGDFRRTSGGLANQQRILKAEISDLEAEIGTALMPTVLKITRAVTTWLAKSENHEKIQRALNSALKIAKQVVEALWQVVVPLSKALQHVVDAMGGWNRAIKVFVAFALAAKLAKIAAELRAIGLALGLSKGAGIVGAASRARLGLAALASASVIGGLSGLLAILGRIAGAAGKIAGYGFGGVPDQPGVANRLPDKTPLLTPAKVGQVVTDRSGRKWRWTGSRWVSADATGPGAAANRPDNRGGARGPGADEPKMIQDARRFGPGSGIKYVWGGASPQTGFDCSGYVMYVYGRSGIKIPHNSVAQFNDPNAIHVPRGQIQAGDALYFRTSGPGAAPQHVGLAISGGANATFIEYFSAGKPAKYNTINAKGGFMGARRWMKIKTSTGGGNDKPKTGGGNDAGTITTGKTGGGAKPVLPASFSVGIENAKRTPGVADDLKALGRAHDFLVEKLSHAKTPAERLPIVKALNAIDAAIKKIKASEAKKKLDQIHAAFEKTWGKLTDAALKAFDRATDRGLDELQRKFDAKMKAFDDGLQATLDAIEATRSELTPAEAEIAALEEARSQKDLEDRIAEARQAIADAQQQEGESDEDFAKRKTQLQKDLDDALYDQKIRALQKQADAERKAKDEAAAKAAKAAQDANQAQKDALQTSYDDQVQAYRDERELLRDHLDEMLADLLKFYLARNELAKKAREDLIAFTPSSGSARPTSTTGRAAPEPPRAPEPAAASSRRVRSRRSTATRSRAERRGAATGAWPRPRRPAAARRGDRPAPEPRSSTASRRSATRRTCRRGRGRSSSRPTIRTSPATSPRRGRWASRSGSTCRAPAWIPSPTATTPPRSRRSTTRTSSSPTSRGRRPTIRPGTRPPPASSAPPPPVRTSASRRSRTSRGRTSRTGTRPSSTRRPTSDPGRGGRT